MSTFYSFINPGLYLPDNSFVYTRNAVNQKYSTIFENSEIEIILNIKLKEPFHSITEYFAHNFNYIDPNDSESRMFLKKILVAKSDDEQILLELFNQTNVIILPDYSLLVKSHKNIQEAGMFVSTACFAMYVKFMLEFTQNQNLKHYITFVVNAVNDYKKQLLNFVDRPTQHISDINNAIIEAGKFTVKAGLVDSFFGNISYKSNQDIYITKTTSHLDKLEGQITICNNDNYDECKKIASSELPAHKLIYEKNNVKAIIHGHPKFAVIMSMICNENNCKNKDNCYTKCTTKRTIQNTPIVSGEVGDGKYGLYRTVPDNISKGSVIVFGHGVFASGKDNFNEAFENLLTTEISCINIFIELIKS